MSLDDPSPYLTNEDLVQVMLHRIGEDHLRGGLVSTPRRVVKSWKELYSGYGVDLSSLFTTFEELHDEMVVVKDIELYSMCEHHMLPFFGKAHIGYLPNKKIVGLSKLARVVDAFARRLQVQERLGDQIAGCLIEHLQPLGVGVVIEARHLCMMARGVAKQNSTTVTSSMQGLFRTDRAVRAEFLSAIR